jgi:hypothetical protein
VLAGTPIKIAPLLLISSWRSIVAAQRAGGYQRPQLTSDVREEKKETAFSQQKTRLNEWSHGESNPDLLNAIQPSSR